MTPRPFVERYAGELPPGRALDLACGTGANAMWLADRGWQVTGVDWNADSLAQLRAAAPQVETHLADLEAHRFDIGEQHWDLIVVSHYLQRDLFPKILRGLKPNGRAIIIVHMFEPGHETSRFSVHPGELRQLFEGARIVAYEEGNPTGRATARIAVEPGIH
ncbi:MAG: hypothetical protein RL328_2048 [Acidobacteriota bacterium]|jgi:SAM-dependent methyltransferase